MKRFHVHLHVDDLARSIAFYNRLFGAAPARNEADYAKWMLDDPPLNFAISNRGGTLGVDHLGIQTDDPAELTTMREQAESAELALQDVGSTSCCYARSDKHWITDPQGQPWEFFHTLDNIPVFNETAPAGETAACCEPAAAASAVARPAGKPVPVAVKAGGCC